MKEIRVARNALLAYLIISALVMSVTRNGDSIPEYIFLTGVDGFPCAGVGPQNDAVRKFPILKRPALPEELGIGDVVDVKSLQVSSQEFHTAARRDRAFHHQDQTLGFPAPDPRQGGTHLPHIRAAVRGGGRAGGD